MGINRPLAQLASRRKSRTRGYRPFSSLATAAINRLRTRITSMSRVAFIGDGSFQYSVPCLATAVQYRLRVIFVVPCNGEYAVLKDLSVLENTPNMPGLDLPELDIVSTAKGFGCSAFGVNTKEDLQAAFTEALRSNGPTVFAVPIQRQRHVWLSELRSA